MSATEKSMIFMTALATNGDIIVDQIDFEDTLGFKAKLSFPLFGTSSYI